MNRAFDIKEDEQRKGGWLEISKDSFWTLELGLCKLRIQAKRRKGAKEKKTIKSQRIKEKKEIVKEWGKECEELRVQIIGMEGGGEMEGWDKREEEEELGGGKSNASSAEET